MLSRLFIPLSLAAFCLAQQPPGALKINVVAGQGAVNNIVMGVAAQPIVEVVDAAGKPVANAEVTFEAPASGPGCAFFGQRTFTDRTDERGRVQAKGLTPNNQQGKFQIKVSARTANAAGEGVIAQANGGPGTEQSQGQIKKNSNKLWWIAGIAAAAAVGGGVAASRNGDSPAAAATKRPVTIGAGPITVGGPR